MQNVMEMNNDGQTNVWLEECPVEGGAQGDCAIVVLAGASSTRYFRKTLKAGSSTERRRRFFKEATLFADLAVQGVPRLVETNASKHAEQGTSLYYIAEYISGDRLDKYRGPRPIAEPAVVGLFAQLLRILSKIHQKEVVHRDIKPENIIVSQGELFLVDFGIAYDGSTDNLTRQGDELGNRFLRLPEYGAGSANKRDIRSDVTLAAAIALYCFTGIYPRSLMDDTGALPHQRSGVPSVINRLAQRTLWNLIFDKAFRHNLAERWSSAADVLSVLDAMSDKHATDLEKAKAILREHGKAINEGALALLKQQLESARSSVEVGVEAIIRELAPIFRTEKQQWVWNPGDAECQSQVRAYPIGEKRYLSIQITIRTLGSQLVGTITTETDSTEVYRAPADGPQPDDLNHLLQGHLLPRLEQFLSKN